MCAYINNREYRQKILKGLITELHNGKSVDEIKEIAEEKGCNILGRKLLKNGGRIQRLIYFEDFSLAIIS